MAKKCLSWAWQATKRPAPSAKIVKTLGGEFRWLIGQHDVYDFPDEAAAHGEATTFYDAKKDVREAIREEFGAGHEMGKWACIR